ncbi:hypothetical protein ACFL59_07350 [Planctomycetota bacterium]
MEHKSACGPIWATRWPGRRVSSALLLLSLMLCGCAVLEPDKRLITHAFDEALSPEDPVAEVVLAPIGIPVGVTVLALDGLFVNPIRFFPEALDDANSVFTEVPCAGLGEVLVFPMRVVTFAVILIGSEVFRCSVPDRVK